MRVYVGSEPNCSPVMSADVMADVRTGSSPYVSCKKWEQKRVAAEQRYEP